MTMFTIVLKVAKSYSMIQRGITIAVRNAVVRSLVVK